MSYYTEFSLVLETDVDDTVKNEIENEITRLGIFNEFDSIDNGCSAFCGWGCWLEDMCGVSAKFPDVLFLLHGRGESDDDLWNAYFINGQYQYCPAKILYDNFDAYKLRKPINNGGRDKCN